MIRFNGVIINRKAGRISHNGAALRFIPGSFKFRLACTLLLAGPKDKRELFDFVYRDDIDGGPLDPRTIDVMIQQLKSRFSTIGLSIQAGQGLGNLKLHWARVEKVAQLEAAE